MARTALILTLVLAYSGRAYAQDAGMQDAGTSTTGCGNITPEGECQGNVVVYCDVDNDVVARIDCPADVDPTAICMLISVDYGVDCALAAGQDCYGEDESGDLSPFYCQGVGPGCLDVDDTAMCAENIGPCTQAEVGTCSANLLMIDCFETQPYLVDCSALGGACMNDACRNLPVDSVCDDETYYCAPGNECTAVPGSPGEFSCRPPGSDAGVGADTGSTDAAAGADAGSLDVSTNLPNPDDEKGCGCTAHGGQVAPVGIFFVMVLLLRRKDRRA